MVLNVRSSYTFDDVLLVPKFSTIESRKDVDLSVDLGNGIELAIPIVSANMKNVTGLNMALKIADMGGLAILHRFFANPLFDQIDAFKTALQTHKSYANHIGISIGVQKVDYDYVGIYAENGVKIICLDIAHGHSSRAINMVAKIKARYPKLLLIVGNVATPEGFCALAESGADVIKVGIGPGSLCSTRTETGNGVPQLSALSDCYDAMRDSYPNVKIIADGGIKQAGDITKALCFSHAVMVGNLLAGTDEAPGDIINVDGKTYKQYSGSSTFKKDHVEGVSALVATKGPAEHIVNKLLQGLRSGCSYQGVSNLEYLRRFPEFVLITNSGLVESHPHDVIVTK